MLLGPSWKMPGLSIPPGTASRCQQCWAGKRRSHSSLLAWLQKGEQGSSSPFPALLRELRAPCTLLAGLQIPKSSSTMKIKIKPKPVLLEQSWSQVLDKAQEFSEQGDAEGRSHPSSLHILWESSQESPPPSAPPLRALGSSPISLPAFPSPPEPTPAAAGRAEGKGQGEWVTRMLWSTLDQQCPIPREGLQQGEAIVYF